MFHCLKLSLTVYSVCVQITNSYGLCETLLMFFACVIVTGFIYMGHQTDITAFWPSSVLSHEKKSVICHSLCFIYLVHVRHYFFIVSESM